MTFSGTRIEETRGLFTDRPVEYELHRVGVRRRLNVLNGDMSLIGPRPHALAHDNYFEKLVGDYAFRHHVKPGLTGLWQTSGRSDLSFDQMVRLDLEYIARWSIWLDLRILLATFTAVIRGHGAY